MIYRDKKHLPNHPKQFSVHIYRLAITTFTYTSISTSGPSPTLSNWKYPSV